MKRLIAFILAGGLLVSMVGASSAHAITVFGECEGANADAAVCKASGEEGEQNAASIVRVVIDTLLLLLGVVAVIMIIWGGVKYVTSRGDAANVKSAKDTVTYAVIGLIVALFAYAIVNFIIDRF